MICRALGWGLVVSALGAAACQGSTGTIDLELVTAPGSTVLDGVQTLRVTLTDPLTVAIADRTDHGFDVSLDVEATGNGGQLIVEGLDANDALVATGTSPPFAISAIDAHIAIFIAPPLTIERAPASLPTTRIGVGGSPLSYGFAIAGGEDDTGARTDDIFVYNAFDHTLTPGLAMPEARSFQTVITGSNNHVYLFGGTNAAGDPTGSTWRFDTTVAPDGRYEVLEDNSDIARTSALGVTLNLEKYVITGAPPIDLDFGVPTARADIGTLPSTGAATTVGGTFALFAGDPIVRLRDDVFDTLTDSAEAEATAAALPDGRIVFAGVGPTHDLLAVSPVDGTSTRPATLSVARANAAVAATDRFLVVAGGVDENGDPIESADVFDATTLAPVATIRCLARSGATAIALSDGQIAIIGGAPANDAIELFTPPPPPL